MWCAMVSQTDSPWTVDDLPDCSGMTAVVTGANSGVGLETTRELACAGADVVMACRSMDRAEAAREEIEADDPTGTVSVGECDLASLDSVVSFSDGVRERHDSLDVLVNNAGVMATPRRDTADGFELQFGVNHLGHFALTGHLLDSLRAAADPRVVTVSSGNHRIGEIDFEDLLWEDSYDRHDAYNRSKLANLLFAVELDRRTDDLTSVACQPGFADTNMQNRAAEETGSVVERLGVLLAGLIAHSPARGAEPTLYAATHPDIEGGEYVGPGALVNPRGDTAVLPNSASVRLLERVLNAHGHPTIQEPDPKARDGEIAARLWERSKELTGVEYDL